MTVTWTSGYNIDGAQPFVEWGLKGGAQARSLAVTLTFDRNSMCGALDSFDLVLNFDRVWFDIGLCKKELRICRCTCKNGWMA